MEKTPRGAVQSYLENANTEPEAGRTLRRRSRVSGGPAVKSPNATKHRSSSHGSAILGDNTEEESATPRHLVCLYECIKTFFSIYNGSLYMSIIVLG